MKTDFRNLTAVQASDLICSTRLGQVTTPKIITAIQRRAAHLVGDGKTIDLFSLVAWLLKNRPKTVAPSSFPSMPKPADATDARLVRRAVKHGWTTTPILRQLVETKLAQILSTDTVSVTGALKAVDAVLEINAQNIQLEQQDRSDQSQRHGGTEEKPPDAPNLHVHLDAKEAAAASTDPAVADGFKAIIGALYRRPEGSQPPASGGDSPGDAARGSGNPTDDRQG